MASPPTVSDGGGGEIIDGPAGISFSCRAPRDSGNGNGNNKKPGRISPQSNLCSGPPPPTSPPSPGRHLRSKHTIVLAAVVVEADSLIESNKYMWGQGGPRVEYIWDLLLLLPRVVCGFRGWMAGQTIIIIFEVNAV